jgi:hypothetical protein
MITIDICQDLSAVLPLFIARMVQLHFKYESEAVWPAKVKEVLQEIKQDSDQFEIN